LTIDILLVDDDERILETYKEILESEGYNVHTALNPYKAIYLMRKQDIQLAILDYNLPKMTGIQLGHLIKKANESIHIMFISGNHLIHELAKQADYNVFHVLSKPINLEKLTKIIKKTISEKEVSKATVLIKPSNLEQNQFTRFLEKFTQVVGLTSTQVLF
jgi:DNA-binding NtrC family response regulator